MRLLCLASLTLLLALAGCAAPTPALPTGAPTAASTAPAAPATAATATATATPDRWLGLLEMVPYPFASPLPPAERGPLDGAYAKVDPKVGTPVPCLRCGDYKPEGGVWRLQLKDGAFRIYHVVTGWRSLGSFALNGSELALFNDPNCTDVVGRYTWALAEGELRLSAIEDSCSIGLRAENLTRQPWLSCQPPNTEAGVSGHWKVPEGCEE